MQKRIPHPLEIRSLPRDGHAPYAPYGAHAAGLFELQAFGAFLVLAGGLLALCDGVPAWAWSWWCGGVVIALGMALTGAWLPVDMQRPLIGVLSFLRGLFSAAGAVRWSDAQELQSLQTALLMAVVLYTLLTCLWLRRRPGFIAIFLGGQFVVMVTAIALGTTGAVQTASIVFGVQALCALATLAAFSRLRRVHGALLQDHRRLRVERDEQAQLLEEATTVKSNFLAAASHDLRQPAQALALFVDELQRRPQLAGQEVLVTRIKAASDNLIAALGALTDIARLDGLGIEPRTEVVDLRALVDRIFSTFQSMADAKDIQLSHAGIDVHVLGDPSVLHSILANFVANAIKYTDRGSVRIHTLSHGTDIEVSVQDTGRGIAEADRPRIYDEFFRGGNAGSGESGMGLGLAIVRRLAHAAGIPIRLESAIGVGSRFILKLPLSLSPARASSSTGVRSEHPLPLADDFLAGLHIVVLENDPAVALSLQDVLEKWGAVVHGVHCTDAMLEWVDAGRRQIDALIVDHHLGPSSNGFQAVEALRRSLPQGAHMPVLMMTGDLDPKVSRMAARQGLALIHKPIPPSRLRAVIVELLGFDEPIDSSGFPTTWQGKVADLV